MSEYIFVYSTFPNVEDADRVARAMIERKLAGCANVFTNAHSYYRWKDEVKREGEVIVILKTRADHWELLRDAIAGAHPYEVPVIARIPMQDSNTPFQLWMDDCLKKPH